MRAEISCAVYALPSMSIDQLVPMWRFTERIVRSGLVIAWRFATSPTSTSPVLRERDDRGRGARAFGVGDDDRLARLEDRDDRVRGAEVDADGLGHGIASITGVGTRSGRDRGRLGDLRCTNKNLESSVGNFLARRHYLPIPTRSLSLGPIRGLDSRPMARNDAFLGHLAEVPLFSALSRKELALVARRAEDVQVDAGRVLVSEGASRCGVLRDPERDRQGQPPRAARSRPSARAPRSASWHCSTRPRATRPSPPRHDMELVVLGQREFGGVIDEVPGVARKLLTGNGPAPARGRHPFRAVTHRARTADQVPGGGFR